MKRHLYSSSARTVLVLLAATACAAVFGAAEAPTPVIRSSETPEGPLNVLASIDVDVFMAGVLRGSPLPVKLFHGGDGRVWRWDDEVRLVDFALADFRQRPSLAIRNSRNEPELYNAARETFDAFSAATRGRDATVKNAVETELIGSINADPGRKLTTADYVRSALQRAPLYPP